MNKNPKLNSVYDIEKVAKQIRGKLVEMSHKGKAAHLGSALSTVDILGVLFWRILDMDIKNPDSEKKDRFILSKGHAASAIYATLAHKGFFPMKLLDTYAKEQSCLCEHPAPSCVPGVRVATGSLGHGLPIGLGMALANKMKENNARVFVLMSDGECNEGSVWEAAMFAASNKLDNVIAIIDYNKWQATGRSNEILALAPLKEKWEKFGWNTYEVDGHNINELIQTLENIPKNSKKPSIIVANTVKGKGISFMEDDNNWHYRIPTEEEVQKAKKELGLI
ncbi:transketolase [Candidatus Woesearchaeota archaeon]|nr:transketolase [Candidatus Woesearchaeota archaeon]